MKFTNIHCFLLSLLLVSCETESIVHAQRTDELEETTTNEVELLWEVISGKRPSPLGQSWKVHNRYLQTTQEWIDQLDKESLEHIFSRMEIQELDDWTVSNRLWARYGELLGDKVPSFYPQTPEEMKSGHFEKQKENLSNLVKGWAKVNPEAAWKYFDSWRNLEGKSLISRNLSDVVAREVFWSWAGLDNEAAFRHLIDLPLDEIELAAFAYFGALSETANFETESRKMENFFESKSKYYHSPWGSFFDKEKLSLELAISWAKVDLQNALDWWVGYRCRTGQLRKDSTQEQWADAERYYTSQFFERFTTPYLSRGLVDMEDGFKWLRAHPDFCNSNDFIDRVIPSIARGSETNAGEFILRFVDESTKSWVIRRLVRPSLPPKPRLSPGVPRSRRQRVDEVISADFAESLMKQIPWEDAEERQMLEKVIAARRKADAKKPPPAEILW